MTVDMFPENLAEAHERTKRDLAHAQRLNAELHAVAAEYFRRTGGFLACIGACGPGTWEDEHTEWWKQDGDAAMDAYTAMDEALKAGHWVGVKESRAHDDHH